MTHKHTPGPWTTDDAEHDSPYQDITIRAGRRNVCHVWIDDAPVPDYNAEQDANAKLIAAAPDLLAALLWAIEHAEAYVLQQLSDGAVGMRDDLDARDRARAAITKATK